MAEEENLIEQLDQMANAARRMSAAARDLHETDLSPREIRKIKMAQGVVENILGHLEMMDDFRIGIFRRNRRTANGNYS